MESLVAEVGRWEPSDFQPLQSAEGIAWIASLPAVVRDLRLRWHLDLDSGQIRHGYGAVVIPANRGGENLVLRLQIPHPQRTLELLALQTWRGRGAVCVLEFDLERGALLLERVDATKTLRSLPLQEAATVAGGLIRRLAVAAPPGLPALMDVAQGAAESLRKRNDGLDLPVPEPWVSAAAESALALARGTQSLLVHADLHYENILAGRREPWLAIDPRPISGDPEHSVPELLWTRADEMADARAVLAVLHAVISAGSLDPARATRWAFVRTIDYWLWGLENGLTIDPQRCRRVAEALAGELGLGSWE